MIDYVTRLIQVSTAKYGLLEKMFHTYERQLFALSNGDETLHTAVVDERAHLIAEIDKLDEQFHVYTERLKSTLGIHSLEELSTFDLPGRTELKSIVVLITALLGELNGKHAAVTGLIEQAADAAGVQALQVTRSKAVSRAYQPGYTMPPPSVFFDKKKLGATWRHSSVRTAACRLREDGTRSCVQLVIRTVKWDCAESRHIFTITPVRPLPIWSGILESHSDRSGTICAMNALVSSAQDIRV